jgi:segregation and condensation protein A
MNTVLQKNEITYKISTKIYQGPLDLLLRLIEKEELDITKVSLSKVTNPFLAHVQKLKSNQADEASNFIILAAKLMQIKSEVLLPRPVERELGEEDPGEELILQLKLYKQYKKIAETLKSRHKKGLRTYIRIDKSTKKYIDHKLDLSDVSVEDLVAAIENIYEINNNLQPIGKVVKFPTSTIKEKIGFITNFLKSKDKAKFSNIISTSKSKNEVVITFLAMLELIKNFKIKASQENLFDDIEIQPIDLNPLESDFVSDFSK